MYAKKYEQIIIKFDLGAVPTCEGGDVSEFARRGGWWVVAQVAIFAGFVWSLGLRAEFPAVLRIVGWALAGAGAALAVGGLMALGPSLTPYPEPLPTGRLIGRGPYRLVRHPIYGGLCLGAVGLALGAASVAALGVALGLLGFFRWKAHREEQRLLAAYPDYAAYRTQTPRMLLPWLW